MFAVTRRPSATTPGRVANLPSSNTSCATDRVAAAPDPMATPMSASLRASASLTPSPVIATTWPRDCSAPTIARFWAGVTRPKTEFVSKTVANASWSSGRSRASIASSTCSPTFRATAPTVRGLSPEMTFSATPCSRKYSNVSAASGRTRSANSTNATASRSPGSVSPSSGASERASSNVRLPVAASSSASCRIGLLGSVQTISGAPMIQLPSAWKPTALHLRAEENGTASSRSHPGSSNAAPSASKVALALSSAAIAPSAAAAAESS